jgi:hypothetical protein
MRMLPVGVWCFFFYYYFFLFCFPGSCGRVIFACLWWPQTPNIHRAIRDSTFALAHPRDAQAWLAPPLHAWQPHGPAAAISGLVFLAAGPAAAPVLLTAAKGNR